MLQDLEGGEAQQSEKSFLLADRHPSSLDEEAAISISRAHSRNSPTKPKASLQVAHDTSTSSQQGPDQGKRLKGLGLAGIATVFQAIMSVCAKILGRSRLIIPALVGHVLFSAKASNANGAQEVAPTTLALHVPIILQQPLIKQNLLFLLFFCVLLCVCSHAIF